MSIFDEVNLGLERLSTRGARVFSIGRSVLGTDVMAAVIGSRQPVVLMHASIHAREHVTTRVLMRLVRDFSPRHSRLVIVPVANPDGVKIATEGTGFLPDEERAFFDGLNTDLSLIKCNARGVDLNVNFNARWGEGRQNAFSPGAANYVGPFPESEPETRALIHLTQRFRPVVSVSWHARGAEIYWSFGRRADYEADYREMAGKYAESTGYPLREAEGSVGGYKDWFIESGYGMGLTIEVGDSDLDYNATDAAVNHIAERTKEVLRLADEHAGQIYRRRIYGRGPY